MAAETPNTPQPAPQPGTATPTWELVHRDFLERDAAGARKYGVRHQHDNGRLHLVDLYQELLDAVVYARAEIERRKLPTEYRLTALERREDELWRARCAWLEEHPRGISAEDPKLLRTFAAIELLHAEVHAPAHGCDPEVPWCERAPSCPPPPKETLLEALTVLRDHGCEHSGYFACLLCIDALVKEYALAGQPEAGKDGNHEARHNPKCYCGCELHEHGESMPGLNDHAGRCFRADKKHQCIGFVEHPKAAATMPCGFGCGGEVVCTSCDYVHPETGVRCRLPLGHDRLHYCFDDKPGSAGSSPHPTPDAVKGLVEARSFVESVPVVLSGLSVNAPATCKAAYRALEQIDAALAALNGEGK